MKILLVEDDLDILAQLRNCLESEGFQVECCTDGRQAIELGLENDYHAAILDPGLPIFAGEQVIARWRARGRRFPILIITGTRTAPDQVRELIRLGVSQYIAKPVIDLDILVEWVRAIASAPRVNFGNVLRYNDTELDQANHLVRRRNKRVDPGLSREEFAVLRELLIAAGEPLTPIELADRALDQREGPKDALIPTYVQRIRRKTDNNIIVTVGGGRGYAAG